MLRKLIKWSQVNFSDLPWRKRRTLYKTYVSEIMLQQTTVGSVTPRFKLFIKKFPTLLSLAQAGEDEVLLQWQGLGYYRRAKNLRLGAIDIKNNYQGRFPKEKSQLLSIKGIGEYTASAIVAIGRNESALAVDANIERVLARLYRIELSKGALLKENIKQNLELKNYLPKFNQYNAREVNEALMDLGRVICQQNKTLCEQCPIGNNCQSYQNTPLQFPIPLAKKAKKFDLNLARFIIKKKNKVYMIQRPQGKWLEGQWELPTYIIKTNDDKLQLNNQYPKCLVDLSKLEVKKTFKTSITKYKIINYVYEKKIMSGKGKYIDPQSSDDHISSATLKAL